MKLLSVLCALGITFSSMAQSASDYVQNGKRKISANDYSGAVIEFTNAIQKLDYEIERKSEVKSRFNTLYGIVYNLRGEAKQKNHNYTGAMEDFDKAIILCPDLNKAYENRGAIKQELKDYPGSIVDLNMAIAINPNDAVNAKKLLDYSKYLLAVEAANKAADNSGTKNDLSKMISGEIPVSQTNLLRKPAPNFTQTNEKGLPVALSSFKGKYVLIYFWASWGGAHGDAENKNVAAAFKKYKNKNFTVMGISLDKVKDNWLDAIEKENLLWVQLSDLKGWNNAVAKLYNVTSLPQAFLVGPDGKIIAQDLRGPLLDSTLHSILK